MASFKNHTVCVMQKFKPRENNGLSVWQEKEMEVCKTVT